MHSIEPQGLYQITSDGEQGASPEGKATAVCAQRAKGVGSFNFQVKVLASNRHASHNTCVMTAPSCCNCMLQCCTGVWDDAESLSFYFLH